VTSLSTLGSKAAFLIAIIALAASTGCAGPTSVDVGPQNGQYRVIMKMDPLTLNPPQLGTLTFGVTDAKTGKPVVAYEPVLGADTLMHTIVISKDLLSFWHGDTDRLVQNEASISTFFPKTGTYYVYTIYKPAGAPLQVFTSTITSGPPSEEATLVEDASSAKTAGSVRVQLVTSPSTLKAGTPAQLVFHLSERGRLIQEVEPYLEAPGHLWIVNERGEDFGHESGAAAAHQLIAPASPSPTEAGATSVAQSSPQATATLALPTFAPGIGEALATITAVSVPTLAPVQQTAQLSVVETPAVQPAIGYGPDIAFTHTFPEEGLYKMWLEFKYRDRVVQVDYVVQVEK
jgi:hypothetical protein